MSAEGVYSIGYAGVAGQGAGALVLKDNKVIGNDPAGGQYVGKYDIDPVTQDLKLDAMVIIQAGAASVNGLVAPHNGVLQFPVSATIPVAQMAGYQHTVHTPAGDIMIVLKKVCDL